MLNLDSRGGKDVGPQIMVDWAWTGPLFSSVQRNNFAELSSSEMSGVEVIISNGAKSIGVRNWA